MCSLFINGDVVFKPIPIYSNTQIVVFFPPNQSFNVLYLIIRSLFFMLFLTFTFQRCQKPAGDIVFHLSKPEHPKRVPLTTWLFALTDIQPKYLLLLTFIVVYKLSRDVGLTFHVPLVLNLSMTPRPWYFTCAKYCNCFCSTLFFSYSINPALCAQLHFAAVL